MAPQNLPREEIARLRTIDSTADRFEAAWRAGAQPRIEDFLTECSPDLLRVLLTELLAMELEWRSRHKLVLSQDDYFRRFPDDAAVVSSVFAEWSRALFDDNAIAAAQPTATEAEQSTITATRPDESSVADTRRLDADRHLDSDVESPSQIGRYEVIKLLGTGAMGAVYLARDQRLHRLVALKVSKLDDNTEEAARIERFQREARAAAALHQPNICPVYDIGVVDGLHFITMAYIDGRTLREILRGQAQYPQPEAVMLVRKLALALQRAHEANVVHRDIKPANIMVDKRNEPIIMDFGLALLTDVDQDARITQSGMIVGSPAYMSPEQISGDPIAVGPASDIYSLGVILYELLAGRLPFKGGAIEVISRIRTANPPSLRSLRPDVDTNLAAIVQRMMARPIKDRYCSMQAVAEDLERWLSHSSHGSEQSGLSANSLASRGSRGASPRSGVLLFTAITLAVALFATVIVLRTRHGDMSIEVSDDRIGVEMDGERIILTNSSWKGRKSVGKHRLSVVINGTLIPIGKSLSIDLDGRSHRLIATLGDVQLTSREFELKRGQHAGLKIKLTPVEIFQSFVDSVPIVEEDFNGDQVILEDKNWFRGLKDGRLVVRRKTEGPGRWRETAMRCPLTPGMIEVDARAVGSEGSWVIGLVNPTIDSAFLFFVEDGTLKTSTHVPQGWQQGTQYNTISGDLPTRTDGGFDRVQLLVRRRSVEIAVNEVRIGAVIDLPFDVTPGEVQLGCLGTSRHTQSAEYDRFAFYPLAGSSETEHARSRVTFDSGTAVGSSDPAATSWELTSLPRLEVPTRRDAVVAYQAKWAESLGIEKEVATDTGYRLSLIPPGTFEMGPKYRVTISKPYYIGTWELRKQDFATFVEETKYVTDVERGAGGSIFVPFQRPKPDPQLNWRNSGISQADDHPVVQVSWNDAEAFCQWQSKKEGITYRLPTEAEWEYACRAGTDSVYHFGDDPTQLVEYAWFRDNSDHLSTYAVGRLKANPWGLFDMYGNVLEWTSDQVGLYPAGNYVDPRSAASESTGTQRLGRGGNMMSDAAQCSTRGGRSHYHERGTAHWATHIIGFRLVREVKQPGTGRVVFESPPAETLCTLVEATPAHEDDYTSSRVILDDSNISFGCAGGRLVAARKTPRPGGGWWAWHRMDYGQGLIDVDLRLLGDRGGWLIVLHNPATNRGARVWLRDGELYVGPSVFDPDQRALSATMERVISANLPLQNEGNFDTLQLLVRKRSVCVYLNGLRMGPPTEFPYDLTPGSLRLGLLGSPLGDTHVEYERLEFRRLKSG